MASSVHYSWTSDENGRVFRRFAHGIEASNAYNSQFDQLWSMFTGLTVVSKLSMEDFCTALKQAWIRLRYEAPIIATKVEAAPKTGPQYHQFVYEVQDQSQVDAWAEETIHKVAPGIKQDLLDCAIQERSRLGMGRFSGHLYVSTDAVRSDLSRFNIIFATPHATTDVRGSFTALHRLLELATSDNQAKSESLEWGDEVSHLYPPLVYATGLRSDGDSPPVDLDSLLSDISAAQKPYLPTCMLRHRHDVQPYAFSDPPILSSLVIDKDQHAKITQAGRTNGTSVTGVVAGILAILTSKYNEVPNAKSVSIWGAATDRRARMPDKYKPYYSQAIWSKSVMLKDMDAITSSTHAIFEEQTANPDFWSVCREFKADLDAFAKDDHSLAMSNDLVMAGLTAKGGIFENVPPAHCFYSSYGKYDNILQHSYGENDRRIDVDDPHCMALCHSLPVVSISSSSWKGRLTIFSQHSRNYYEQADVNAFYKDLKTCLDVIATSA